MHTRTLMLSVVEDLVGRSCWLDPLTIRRSSSLSHSGRKDTWVGHIHSSLFWLLEEAAAGGCPVMSGCCDVGLR